MIKNIIFDLGGVILETDFQRSAHAFAELDIDIHQVMTAAFWQELDRRSDAYTLAQFSDHIRKYAFKNPTDAEIEKAWIALLGDFDSDRMAFLTELSKDYQLYLFSNTDAILTKAFEKKCREQCGRPLESYFKQIYYSQNLGLRKPDIKAFQKVLRLSNLIPYETLFIDDRAENVEAARKTGMTAYQLSTPEELTQQRKRFIMTHRVANIERNTKETQIMLSIDLDGTGKTDITTGIGFLDHMLTLLAFHSDMDITLTAHGDHETLGMDSHHVTEDIAIALGKCIDEALGERRGITRYGSFTIPMDEALVTTDLDISGRPYLVFNTPEFANPKLGGYDSEMTEEFFRALSYNAGITAHINAHYGKNTHHIIEGMFKSYARALKLAVAIDEKKKDDVPSSKGIL